ncbi:MAG: glycosyltransferase family 2 protein [Candidatus Saccharimonas sp.]
MARVAIVVLNWNGADDAIACIDSLLKQSTLQPDIFLVDNNSEQKSIDRLEGYIKANPNYPLTLIKNTVNSGYTGGNNLGFTVALKDSYDFIGTLNPDATADTDWVERIVEELQANPSAGVATGILAREDGTHIDTTGEQYSTWGIPGPRGRDSSLEEVPSESEYIFASTGGGFIARAELLRDIGLFDEKFFMYFEDVDFCFRAQLAGYKVRYTPKAIAYHKLSTSTNKVPGLAVYNTFKNLPMLYVKNMPLGLWFKTYPRFTLAYTLILGNAIAHGRGIPALKGWFKSWLLIPHMFRERSRIQRSRRVSTEYINSIMLHDIPPEQTGLRKFRKIFTGK